MLFVLNPISKSFSWRSPLQDSGVAGGVGVGGIGVSGVGGGHRGGVSGSHRGGVSGSHRGGVSGSNRGGIGSGNWGSVGGGYNRGGGDSIEVTRHILGAGGSNHTGGGSSNHRGGGQNSGLGLGRGAGHQGAQDNESRLQEDNRLMSASGRGQDPLDTHQLEHDGFGLV